MGTGWQQLTEQDFKEGVLFLPIDVYYALNPSFRQNEYWLMVGDCFVRIFERLIFDANLDTTMSECFNRISMMEYGVN